MIVTISAVKNVRKLYGKIIGQAVAITRTFISTGARQNLPNILPWPASILCLNLSMAEKGFSKILHGRP